MGYVKKQIDILVKEHGSVKAARSFANNWYSNGIRDRKVNEVSSVRERFRPGKIYSFDYSPITKDLQWYDKHPVVLALDSQNDNDLGVNLNLLPIRIKEQLLDDLYGALSGQIKSAKGKSAASDKPLKITYDGIKAYLDRYGFGFAIRQYKPNRKTSQAVVSYDAWPKIALANLIELNGASVNDVRLLHSQYMRN